MHLLWEVLFLDPNHIPVKDLEVLPPYFRHIYYILPRKFMVLKIVRLDYQPLFREMSQRSLPKSRLDA